MNDFQIFTLKALRRIVKKCGLAYLPPSMQREMNPDKASEIIYNLLIDDKPCMIARFGSTELSAIINYLGVSSNEHSVWKFIWGEQPEWWWNKSVMNQMQQWSGFFPPTEQMLNRFCQMMLEDAKEIDVLGSWIEDENLLTEYVKSADIVHLRLLEPFWSNMPWTRVLDGMRVLVVHSFAETIERQYVLNRRGLFVNDDILPEFHLDTIKAVQSLGGDGGRFSTWFDALEYMKSEIDSREYDICLIGCGAYGFPLAAHVKRQGKKAVHLGGALQLLFGIKGNRWENPNYGVKEWGIPRGSYSSLMNDKWVRPDESMRPKNAQTVEGACYW